MPLGLALQLPQAASAMTGCPALLCLRLPCSSTYAPAARQWLRTRTSFDRRAILVQGAKRQSCLERQCGRVPPRRQGSAHTRGVSMGTRQADTITVHAHMWSDELARRLGATLLLVCLARLGYFIPIPGRVSGQRAPGCQKLQCLQQVMFGTQVHLSCMGRRGLRTRGHLRHDCSGALNWLQCRGC
jgi:hypothetical protein